MKLTYTHAAHGAALELTALNNHIYRQAAHGTAK